jgi:predicted SnoaL-like aldol condensation-catalyzing enzyme
MKDPEKVPFPELTRTLSFSGPTFCKRKAPEDDAVTVCRRADQFFTREYIQHNPNAASGRDAIVQYIRNSRPQREIQPTLGFPLISLVAEGDMVVVAMVTWEDDPEKPGEQYATTHFDMYRVENGLIAEHWDHVPKSPAAKSFDPNSILEKAPKK